MQAQPYNHAAAEEAQADPSVEDRGLSDATSGNGVTPVVLMVAEKPSIAGSIAQALAPELEESLRSSPPLYEFLAPFQGAEALFRVTSVKGHVHSTDFLPEYQNWGSTDPRSLFSAPVIKKPVDRGGKAVARHLATEGKNVNFLVLWLDCDSEGENICFEVIDIVKPVMKRRGRASAIQPDQILRARFSAVNSEDIHRAMASLGQPNLNLSLAVDARAELDLKVGVAWTRFQTQHWQGRWAGLRSETISYGPCQTPTLGFCVQRADEISRFRPEAYWVVDPGLVWRGRKVTAEWGRGRIFHEQVAETFRQLVRQSAEATVVKVETTTTRRSRPYPLNTVAMLKKVSKQLGMGPHEALRTAESLYLAGLISYPRTESTAYPMSMHIRGVLQLQQLSPRWGQYVQALLEAGPTPPKVGDDMGDHPPITPQRRPESNELSSEQGRLLDLISRHFIATVSPDATFLETKVTVEAGGEAFYLKGNKVLEAGFLSVLANVAPEDQEVALPELKPGDRLPMHNVTLCRGETSPPGLLTESELITLMERHGIGTDASIAQHIHNVTVRKYVQLGPGRTLVPTQLGTVLVHGYQRVDPDLVLPKVRAEIEQQCALIAQGLAPKERVVEHALGQFLRKFDHFVQRVELMDQLFEATFSPLKQTWTRISTCGDCMHVMQLITLQPQRLYCLHCQKTYRLPQNGVVKLYKGLRCPLDKFELLLFSLGNADGAMGNTYPLCPRCYDDPPFEGMTDMGCNTCPQQDCQHSLAHNAVCPCPGTTEDDGLCTGTMVLDVNSKPNWKLGCNRCQSLVRFHGSIHSMATQPEQRCPDCGNAKMRVEFHKDKTPLKDGATRHLGCIACDDLLSSLVELTIGRARHTKLSHRPGGRGRRGARGGRGGNRPRDPLMSFDKF